MDMRTLESLIDTRGLVRIGESHGWCAGVVGIAMGYRPLYHSVKVGFVDENGNYTGEYTVVPFSAVEVATEPQDGVRIEIEYADGTTESVKNIPSGEVAAGIYAEATGNDRVRRAVLYRADGTEARTYLNTVVPVRPGSCGVESPVTIKADVPEIEMTTLVCARESGHLGLHRNTRMYGERGMVAWRGDWTQALDSGA